MKVYNFDQHDKFFLYEEEANLDPIGKKPILPAFATFTAPPTSWPEGMIPVFNGSTWDIVENNFWKPRFTEITYYSGRDTSGIPILPKIEPFVFFLIPSIPRLMNPALFEMRFSNRIEIINLYVKNIYIKHQTLQSALSQMDLLLYKTEIEVIIYLIKKSLDDLITAHYVRLYIKKIITNHKIEIQSIGDLFSKRLTNKIPDVINNVKDSIKFTKYEDFLRRINDLHNSLKHDLFQSETDSLVGTPIPTICAFKTNHGDLNEIEFHNHYLGQFILGFSDFLTDNIINLKES